MLIGVNAQKHFEDSQYESRRVDGWRKLKSDAIPTLFDVPNPPHKLAGTRRPLKRRCSSTGDSSADQAGW